jgi:hypothetical protein
MVMNKLQDGLLNSRIALRASRLNCQNIFFFQMEHILFFSNSDRDSYSENNNVFTSITSHKKITLTFETNDEHQARSYQNVINNQIKSAVKTNDK